MSNVKVQFALIAASFLPCAERAPAQEEQPAPDMQIETVYPPMDLRAIDLEIKTKNLSIDADLLGPLPDLALTPRFKKQLEGASLTEEQIEKIRNKCAEIILKRPDIKVTKGETEIFIDADLLGDGPSFSETAAYNAQFNGHEFTAKEKAEILKAAKDALEARGEYLLTLPDKKQVSIDAHKLGSDYRLNVGFLMQFDPHFSVDHSALIDMNPRERRWRIARYNMMLHQAESTDPDMIKNIIDHMKEHGVTEEFIEQQRAKCEAILREQREPKQKEQGAVEQKAEAGKLSFG